GSAMVAATDLAERIATVRQRVADAARAAGRDPDEVAIVAVSKTVGREAVDEAYRLGVRRFGENRVQAAAAKFAEPLPADAALHLIGHLQSNKARTAARLFDLIESVDRLSVIDALEREGARLDRPIPVLLQVNLAREPQKAGCPPEAAADLAVRIAGADWLDLRGLMTIAPLVADPEATRPVFAGLRRLRDELQRAQPALRLERLSMGMTNDFPIAIAEGATEVRIGRAIFGG
ncbi:MAG TPA: YggS family pyridoxal phosphate-dependent enzyme, partial [Thermomicrobiales bacterium]|nr:YggS family pyridoxal phosphate-dependent enzyme [Thermomicrobiales bacterium]